MRLVIFADSTPPKKPKWNDQDQKSRGEWSEIYEAITNWFCYSNGLRKELNLDVVIGDKTIRIFGETIRYLAPSLRSVASVLWHAYNGSQPGTKLIDTIALDAYEAPYFVFSTPETVSKQLNPDSNEIGTLFINSSSTYEERLSKLGVTKIVVLGRYNSQKLVCFLYT